MNCRLRFLPNFSRPQCVNLYQCLFQELCIEDCNVVSIHDLALVEFLQLSYLDITNSNLKNAPSLKQIKGQVRNLILSRNHIGYLDADYFEGCDRLEFVHLDHNDLQTMPDFSPIRDIVQIIDVGDNRITECASLCDDVFTKLQVPIVSHRIKS